MVRCRQQTSLTVDSVNNGLLAALAAGRTMERSLPFDPATHPKPEQQPRPEERSEPSAQSPSATDGGHHRLQETLRVARS
jgi:hypothetical protein